MTATKKVFIIHGWTYTLDAWTVICAELRTRKIEPILLKVPGLTTPSDKVWDIDGYVEWLDKKLKGEDKPVVIGHSNGGRIALSYIQKYPDKLRQLILIGSAGISHTDPKTSFKLRLLRILAKLGKPLIVVPMFKQVFYKVIGAKDYFNAPPNMKQTMQNMLAADKLINLAKINLPVTLIWGREDKITPLQDGRKMAACLVNANIHIIDNAKHSPYATEPKKVAELIANTLEEKQ